MIHIDNKPKLSIWDKIYKVSFAEITEVVIDTITFDIAECSTDSKLAKSLWRNDWPVDHEWKMNPNRFYISYLYWYWTSCIQESSIPEFSNEYSHAVAQSSVFLSRDDAENAVQKNLEKYGFTKVGEAYLLILNNLSIRYSYMSGWTLHHGVWDDISISVNSWSELSCIISSLSHNNK